MRWRKRSIPALVLGVLIVIGCSESKSPLVPGEPQRFEKTLLALGDSYTVGQSLPQEWSWPYQLADSLAVTGDSLATMSVLAQTGWTTRDLLDALRNFLARSPEAREEYSAVTVMIGVNNQNRGVPRETFAAEMDTLFNLAIALTGGDRARVLAFSIPDYGLTPVGDFYGRERVSSEIAAFNLVLAARAAQASVELVDITTLSELVVAEPGLVSRDGLHYSREMYRRWTELMLPLIRTRLELGKL